MRICPMKEISGRVLCIEGNRDACDLVKIYLGLCDYDVVTACRAAEGFELASNLTGNYVGYLRASRTRTTR